MISTKYSIREKNEITILNTIISKREISRADLSAHTGMNKASVSSITKKLLDNQLICESHIGDSSTQGGRKPIILTLNSHSSLVVAFDLGHNYIEAMLAYIDGTIIDFVSKPRTKITKETVVHEMKLILDIFFKNQPTTPYGIVGVTAAVHGVVFENEIKFTPHYDLDQLNLYSEITSLYDVPFWIHNEANLAALGEYTFSSDYESLVTISIHSGIGAGIVQEGKLQFGNHGEAGEVGHTILFPGGKKCP